MSDDQPTVAISQDFMGAFAAIPRAQQKKVQEFVGKFRADPFSAGINYEKFHQARDPNFRSVRIDQDYRAIVLKPDTGNVYVLLWVDKHDDAYDWARRHRCDIHPQTGSLQLLQTRVEAGDTDPAKAEDDAGVSATSKGDPLFADLRDRELLRLGVPNDRLELVRTVHDEDGLEALETELPRESFEALYMLAAGESLQQVEQDFAASQTAEVDTEDFAAALQQPHSLRRFVVVEDDAALQAILEAPLEKWRVFLHPSQRRLVQWDTNGPVRVLGGAGTGKTVVAMHRARWLVNHLQEGAGASRKILFTTFTANLATDIRENLKKICTSEELERIEVTHVDQWVSRFLRRNEYPGRIVYDNDSDFGKCWDLALDQRPAEVGLPDSFYREEWERVILPQRIEDRTGYFRARRTGRGVALSRMQRAAIWPVFEELRIAMHQRGLRTIEDATQDAAELIEQGRGGYLPYYAIVVDEAQDMGPQGMRLLRQIVPRGKNDLFIVGDGHQRIYRRRYALSHCGIEVRGRSRKLRINYRTTEETRRFAVALLEGTAVDDLDGGDDDSKGYRSLMHGTPPEVVGFDSFDEELAWVAQRIRELQKQEIADADICLVARTNDRVTRYQKALEAKGVTVRPVSRKQADRRDQEGVRLATMHRVKGLEFRHVFIVDVNDGVIPLRYAVESSEDETERRATRDSERALLHVAATRAINGLYVTHTSSPSPFLTAIA
ncbi:DNA helicase [Thioalkalivibrio versutus]|uniref:DNA 3'-5' helicase n=1 Tax=Thioalkalivibrio versutus TaxID=106634 RepID=A0A0G3G3I0_9GAMM|nr:UvrD-helicase domain-containing protein [Thioalkalivibrio versutus]AKJ94964.1 DNA helicase [Thioalkalivibrio versutus]